MMMGNQNVCSAEIMCIFCEINKHVYINNNKIVNQIQIHTLQMGDSELFCHKCLDSKETPNRYASYLVNPKIYT